MRNLFLIIFTVLFSGVYIPQAQVKQLNNAPLYELGGHSSKGIAYFEDENLQDSLKVFFRVNVAFKSAIKAGVTPSVESVRVLEMRAINLQKPNYPQEFLLNSKNNDCYKQYRYLWHSFVPYITSWYQKLPYEKMINTEYYGLKTIPFTGVFVLVPLKRN